MSLRISGPAAPSAAAPAIPAADAVAHAPVNADARRGAFLQVIAEGLGTHLADNVDHLFEPWGRELPDPAGVGVRVAEQLEVLDRCAVLWSALGDEPSRALFLKLLAFR